MSADLVDSRRFGSDEMYNLSSLFPTASSSADDGLVTTGTTMARNSTMTETLLSVPPSLPPLPLPYPESFGLTVDINVEEDFSSNRSSQQQPHATIRTNDVSFFHSSIRNENGNGYRNDHDETIVEEMLPDFYGMDMPTTTVEAPTVAKNSTGDAASLFSPAMIHPQVPLPSSKEYLQPKYHHHQEQVQTHSSDPSTESTKPLHKPPNQSIPQSISQTPMQQYQHQSNSQPLTPALPMDQLLTSLNQLAAVSSTPQNFQAVLQSLGLPHAVLMAAATSLAQMTNPASTSLGCVGQLSPTQLQQQQQPIGIGPAGPQQSTISIQQQQHNAVPQLGISPFGITDRGTKKANGLESQMNLLQRQISSILQSQAQSQQQLPYHSLPPKQHSSASPDILPESSHGRINSNHILHAQNNTSKNKSTNKNTTTILNNKEGLSVNTTTNKSANATYETDAFGNTKNHAANVHISGKETNNKSKASSCVLPSERIVNTTQDNSSRITSTTVSSTAHPSGFALSHTMDNDRSTCVASKSRSNKTIEKDNIVHVNTATTTPSKIPKANNSQQSVAGKKTDLPSKLTREPGCQSNSPVDLNDKEPVSGGNVMEVQNLPTCTIILPCRARGMPPDHNFRNAHFVIPPNVQHGQELVCSHSVCRQRGNKFRYCLECRIPVAKRNFHQRHSHGLVAVNNSLGRIGDRSTVPGVVETSAPHTYSGSDSGDRFGKLLAAAEIEEPPKTKKGLTEHAPGVICKSSDKAVFHRSTGDKLSGTESDEPSLTSSSDSYSAHSTDFTDAVTEGEDSQLQRSDGSTSISPAQQLQWAALLKKRPNEDDADSMSAWLLEVMAVSDTKRSSKSNIHRPRRAGDKDTTRLQADRDVATVSSSEKLLMDNEDGEAQSQDSSSRPTMTHYVMKDHNSGSTIHSKANPMTLSNKSENLNIFRDNDESSSLSTAAGHPTGGFKRKLPSSIVCETTRMPSAKRSQSELVSIPIADSEETTIGSNGVVSV